MIFERLTQYGPFPLRILAGVAFIAHGLPKLSNISGSEQTNIVGLPASLALPVGLLEVVGGIVLLLGLLTRIASILLMAEMIGSTIVVKLPKGFVGGYEVDLLLMALTISLILTGPGRLSIEWNILRREIFPRGKQMILQQKQGLSRVKS